MKDIPVDIIKIADDHFMTLLAQRSKIIRKEKELRGQEIGCISRIAKGSAIPEKALLCNGSKIDIKKYSSLRMTLKGLIRSDKYYLPDLTEDDYIDYIIWH